MSDHLNGPPTAFELWVERQTGVSVAEQRRASETGWDRRFAPLTALWGLVDL